ncbi:MAG: carboxypeptidase regulatory-like domain-containing protein, partial [Patescibacteria group bacterium]
MRFKLPFLSIFLFALLFGLFVPKTAFADTVTLSGSVKDSGGNAISGATVSVNDANSSSTTTDSSGNYTLVISNGTYNVQATPPAGSTFSPA